MKLHFISGLPRAGSTLLASILSQNPLFKASVMSPTGQIVSSTLTAMGPANEAAVFLDVRQKAGIIEGIFEGYYSDPMPHPEYTIFDNNRRWTAHASLLATLYPDSRIICCLRPPADIVDSFERLFQKNPLSLSVAYGGLSNTTVYERVTELMKSTGVVGYSYNAFRSAFFGPHAERLVCVNYDDLARFPDKVMAELHHAIGEPAFAYDFENIKPIPGTEEYDRTLHTPGLHTLLPKVVYQPRASLLPPELRAALPSAFWRKEAVTSAG